jgi:hypothetical protein
LEEIFRNDCRKQDEAIYSLKEPDNFYYVIAVELNSRNRDLFWTGEDKKNVCFLKNHLLLLISFILTTPLPELRNEMSIDKGNRNYLASPAVNAANTS